jgi:hypothetical protein
VFDHIRYIYVEETCLWCLISEHPKTPQSAARPILHHLKKLQPVECQNTQKKNNAQTFKNGALLLVIWRCS